MNKVLMSSQTIEWETPQWFFDTLHKEFNFDLDVCATEQNSKCGWSYYDKNMNALLQSWKYHTCWMNPPYGRNIKQWVKKAFDETRDGRTTVVALLPARTDTQWFHQYCIYNEIRFLQKRLNFSQAKSSAPFPSMVVIFNKFSSGVKFINIEKKHDQ